MPKESDQLISLLQAQTPQRPQGLSEVPARCGRYAAGIQATIYLSVAFWASPKARGDSIATV